MYSFLMAENRTEIPSITICNSDGVIFADIPKGCISKKRRICPASVRLEIYDNFMKQLAVVWVPVAPYENIKIIIFNDHIQLIPEALF